MGWIEYIVLFAVAALFTIALVPLARRIAVRFDAIDYPSARRVNMLPVPRLGGIAMFGGAIAALVALQCGIMFLGWPNPFVSHDGMEVNYLGVAIGVVFMFLVGAVDDVVDLNPKLKMGGQVVAACIVAGSGVLLSSIHNPIGEGYIEFGWVAYPLTVFYLVAFANIINLIDGLDGLAAGITGISAITIFTFAVLTHRPDAAVFGIILIGICAGFLKWNFFPASIFMAIRARCSWAFPWALSRCSPPRARRCLFPCSFPSLRLASLFWIRCSPSFAGSASTVRSIKPTRATSTID